MGRPIQNKETVLVEILYQTLNLGTHFTLYFLTQISSYIEIYIFKYILNCII